MDPWNYPWMLQDNQWIVVSWMKLVSMIHGRSMDKQRILVSWLKLFPVDYPWIVHGYSMDYQWIIVAWMKLFPMDYG